jgi:hypothetical protein
MPPQSSNSNEAKKNDASKRSETIKRGWGNKTTFMLSYGLKPYDPDDVLEADAILDLLISDGKDEQDGK